MAKWNYVFVIELSFISMNLHFGCSAHNIQSDVCLARAIDFAWRDQACWFQLKDARGWLERDTYSCSKKCNVKIEGLEEGTYYKLKYLVLRIDGFIYNSKTIDMKCGFSYGSYGEKKMEIFCREDVDISQNMCTFSEGCEDQFKTCVRSPTGLVGFCVCKSGYIGFENECFEGNLKLNDWCQQSEQCSGTVGSVCENHRCVCRPGYIPLNDSNCFSLDTSKNLCTFTKGCKDQFKTCVRSRTEQVGFCVCKSAYIGFGNECLEGNLKLNDRCQQSEQCSGTVGSVCENHRCVCRPGYIPLNDSNCFSLDTSKNLCTLSESCEDRLKTCVRSPTEQVGFCVCKSGYIGFGNECLEGNLKLNDRCQQSEQCSGTVGSVCQNYRCVCRPGYIPLNDSNCFSPDISDDLCTSHKECGEVSKTCSMKGRVGICTCKSGFIGFGKECLKGYLSLYESCQQNEQCSVVFASVCQNNTCSCSEGYVSSNNDSECSLPPSVSNAQANAQDQKDDNTASVTVGAGFGGLILGIVLTVLGAIIYKYIRNGKPKAGKKQDQKVEFFNNTSYETEREAHQNHSIVQSTNERKVVNVPPFAHSMDLPVTKNKFDNKGSMANSHDVNNDVYNHLHEKEEDSDIDETYDHAHGNINRTTEESDYSNLDTGRRYMAPDVPATKDSDYDKREPHGDYSSLKKQ